MATIKELHDKYGCKVDKQQLIEAVKNQTPLNNYSDEIFTYSDDLEGIWNHNSMGHISTGKARELTRELLNQFKKS